MKSKLAISFFLLVFLFSTVSSEAYVSKPDRSEVIEEISKVTGLTNDAVSLALKDSPKLLDTFSDVVTTIKIVNLLSEAKDEDAAVEVFNYSAEKVLDKVLPPNVNLFIKGLKVYKTSLELYRDYVFIPILDNQIYERYRETRLQNFKRDLSKDALEEAYTIATMGHNGKFPNRNYYAVVNKMYEDYIKAKGYNKNLMSEKMKKKLWNEIQEFWMYRMEARFIREMIQSGQQDIINHIWNQYSIQLNQLKAKAKNTKNELSKAQENKKQDNSQKKQDNIKNKQDNSQQKEEMNQLQKIFESQFSKDGKITYSQPWQYDNKSGCYTFSYCYVGSLGDKWCWDNVCITPGQAKEIIKRGSWK